jgi:hypothetical protein
VQFRELCLDRQFKRSRDEVKLDRPMHCIPRTTSSGLLLAHDDEDQRLPPRPLPGVTPEITCGDLQAPRPFGTFATCRFAPNKLGGFDVIGWREV